jgi:hypothetical protein
MHTLLNRVFLVTLSLLSGSELALPSATAEEGGATLPVFAATATEDLIAKEGQRVLVYGETARCGKSQSGMNFVNFKDGIFSLVTFKSDLGPFQNGEPADVYDQKRLAVTGVISIYKDKPQIKLTSPDQVRVLAADEAWPEAPAPEKKEAPATAKPAADRTEPAKTTEEPKKKPAVDPKLYFK